MMFESNHTPYTKKKDVELAITSFTISIVFGANCKFDEPQNDPTFGEHVGQGLHIVMGKVLSILIHLLSHPYFGQVWG
jgi:hypothetical protein